MTDAETAFLHHLEHATLRVAAHAVRRASELSSEARRIIAQRPGLLREITLTPRIAADLPIAELWAEAIEHDSHHEQELIHLLRFMPELEPLFTSQQVARFGSDIDHLIDMASHPDPQTIWALFQHAALFPRDPHHGYSAPPWDETFTPTWGEPEFAVRPTTEQWRRLADHLLMNPALESVSPYPLLRWLFRLPEPPDPRVLLERPHLRLATAGHWCTPPALRSALFEEAMSTLDLVMLNRLLFSRRLLEHEQAAVLQVVPLETRARVLQYGAATLPLLERLADDPALTRDLIDPDGSGYVDFHVDDVRSSDRLESTLLIRFGLQISWAIS